MKTFLFPTAAFCLCATLTALGADDKTKVKEQAKPKSAEVAPTTKSPPAKGESASAPTTTSPKPTPAPEATLPTVEVNKKRITELDRELHEQERNIAREAKNTKPSEVDTALNSAAKSPTIFGGYTTNVRAGLAQERIELMEFEKDLTEAIARAKTKEEKAALKKQLEDIRTMRRTLEAPSSGERSK